MHEDEQQLTILTFNAGPDMVCNLVHGANLFIQEAVENITADAPPKEKWN